MHRGRGHGIPCYHPSRQLLLRGEDLLDLPPLAEQRCVLLEPGLQIVPGHAGTEHLAQAEDAWLLDGLTILAADLRG